MTTSKIHLLSTATREEIDRWIKKYPPQQQQSAVLPALRIVQEQNGGSLTEPLMEAVAEYLKIPNIAVFEVATFYSMYSLEPVGKHKLAVCTSISCFLCGSEKIVKHLEERLGIKMGETTSDGQFTLMEAECLAACGGAPAMLIDNKIYRENVTPEKIDAILTELKQEAAK